MCIRDRYQCGFRQNRFITDQFTLCTILEKCFEYNTDLRQLFVYIKQIYNQLNSQKLVNCVKELGYNNKLINLVKKYLKKKTPSV